MREDRTWRRGGMKDMAANMRQMKEIKANNPRTSKYRLLTGLFFKLLPYQVLLLIITSVNGIVDSIYASNVIGQTAMSAIGLFGPLNHFL